MRQQQLSVEQDKQLQTQYELEKRLGQGCFGVIYRATNRATRRQCALKLESIKSRSKQTLKREYLILKALEGIDGVPAVYSFQRTDSCYLIEMQLLQTDLSFITQKNIQVEPTNICRMGSQLIRVLQNIHAKGVIHRDLKPQNIMLDQNSHLYIVDFGISRRLNGPEDDSTKKQSFVGTPRYASKNAHIGQPLGPLDDIESLLYILIFLIKRRLPWMNNGKEGLKKLDQIRKTKLEAKPEQLAEGLPECFSLALKYIADPKKTVDYQYLSSIFRKNYQVVEQPQKQVDNIFFRSILEMGMDILKKGQQTKSKPQGAPPSERRTSIENNPNFLGIPSVMLQRLQTSNTSQLVIVNSSSSFLADDDQWLDSMKEMQKHEETIEDRILAVKRSSAFQFLLG